MAKLFCKYHPKTAARWQCAKCACELCAACVRLGLRGDAQCLSCRSPVTAVDLANRIPPFWEQLPKFFLYPLNFDALMYLIGLALVGAFAAWMTLILPIAIVVIFFVLTRYGYLVLFQTARGFMAPPDREISIGSALPIKQAGIFMVTGIAVYYVDGIFGKELGYVAALMAEFCLPASIMVLAITGSFIKAASPLSWFSLISSVGWPYCLLWVFLALLSLGSNVAVGMLAKVIPGWLMLGGFIFVAGYFLLIMFHMMGYVIYQYHNELGFSVDREYTGDAPATEVAPESVFERELDNLLADGMFDEAKKRLGSYLEREGGDPSLKDRYIKLAQLTGDNSGLQDFGARYITSLLELDQPKKAVEVYRACIDAVPTFTLQRASEVDRLSAIAEQMRDHNLALRMLDKFAQRFPSSDLIPTLYLRAAQILCEHKHDDAAAKKILQSLLARYPNDALTPAISEYSAFVERLHPSVE